MHTSEPSPSAAPEPAARARRHKAGLIGASLVLSLYVLSLAASDAMFFINDGPQHLYAAVAALGVDEARGFDRFVVANLSPTDRGITDIIQSLTPLLGWRAAYKAAVCAAVLLWAWGFLAFAVALAPRRSAIGLLGFAFAFQTPLFLGLLPFVLGTGVAMLGAAAFLSTLPRRPRLLSAGLCFALAAHVHVVASAIVGAVLAALVLAEAHARARRLGELALVGAWPAVVLCVVWWMSRDLDAGLVVDPAQNLLARARALPSLFLLGGLEPLAMTSALLAGAVWCAPAARASSSRASAALLASGAALIAFSWFAPSAFAGWGGAGDRTIPLGFACVFLSAPIDALGPRLRALAYVVAAALALGVFVRVTDVQRHVRALHTPLLEALPSLEPSPRFWYGISARSTGVHAEAIPAPLEPAVHAAQLAALALGGVVEESHTTSRALHVALLRPNVARLPSSDPLGGNYFPMLSGDELQDLALVPRIAGLAAPFDGLLLYGPAPMPSVRAAFARFGFRSVAEAGGLSALVLDRCSYDVALFGGAPGARVLWDVGPAGVPYGFARFATVLDADGGGTASLSTLCGTLWLRPVEGRCADALNTSGVALAVGARDATAALRCSLEP